ncbi:MAG: NAD(P)-dependent oxidoreductase [Alphaproteobacteria bacterium]|nr:NAD(P)-dependent oxidoreductase [Alphaproteobacteria bacterium]
MTINRLLITGAGGVLGKVARAHYQGKYPHLRLSDRVGMDPAGSGEEIVQCDLVERERVEQMLEGVDAVIHFGGQPVEADWDTVINSNLIGAINLFEGARKGGAERIIFASSNHAIGMHARANTIDDHCEPRPDTRYGLSKAFGEDLGRLYAYKFGIRSMNIRIGSCFPKPFDARSLASWLSFRDLCQLLDIGLNAEYQHEIIYGVSDNPTSWWDNSNAARLGYKPQDGSEDYRAEVEHLTFDDPVGEALQGGMFSAEEFYGDLTTLV